MAVVGIGTVNMKIPPLEQGCSIGSRYCVIRHIGSGGMGTVVEVEDSNGDRLALKYCDSMSDVSRRRFEREVRIMADIEHDHVVQILDSDFSHKPPYFVMPLAKNTLEDEIPILSKNEDLALDAFGEMCKGIQAIHQSQAVHRDIKPQNALRLENGSIVISDLGLAKLHDRDTTTLTQADQFLGTRVYSAPEQLLPEGSRDADTRTDVFQLGKTLYHMVTGQMPALIDPTLVEKNLSHVLRRATRDNPADRYQSVAELMDAIATYRAAKDPANDPKHVLENLLEQCTALAKAHEYDRSNVANILQVVGTNDKVSNETIVDVFEKIPRAVLPVISREFSGDLIDALKAYCTALDDVVGGYSYSYAETVANRMNVVFENAEDLDVRTLALEATLIAACQLHRFAAMDVFNRMLQDVSSDEAIPVSEMLRRRSEFYAVVANQVPSDRLAGPVREVRDEIVG